MSGVILQSAEQIPCNALSTPPAPSLPRHPTIPKTLPKKENPNRRRKTMIFAQQNPSETLTSSQHSFQDLIKSLGRWVWGSGLPPGALVGAVRVSWLTAWKAMMTQMAPSDSSGSYTRPNSQFRGCPDKNVIQPGRFHLYAAWACPWAHRALIVRALKGLESSIGLSVLWPGRNGYWEFSGPQRIGSTVCRTLRDVYKLRPGGFDGRATVPMLWDCKKTDVVNNESSDIIEILNSEFNDVAENPDLDLAPPSLTGEILRWNELIYSNVNNGVYRCGFAQSQGAYEAAVNSLFDTLDIIEAHLGSSRYLCGDVFTLADVRLFTTLFRFDLVYHSLFKCNKKTLSEYPNIYGYVRDIYQIPGVASTCNIQAIMDGYYRVLFPLNPSGIKPMIPLSFQTDSLNKAHDRGSLSVLARV
eukprot:TRINITY_DN5227_c0_g1_i1.p1 TRINITY_DN5227_c0_g1~~TRINITY_DN5227_c0_g1_i1.p1  ORF type:complete len:414 (+),score=33.62 TRINITY_DN5227_c0_g1_i1:117-1358(+)